MANLNRISLDGFREIDNFMTCPDCDSSLLWGDTVGYGEYPIGGWRNSMRPNKTIGIGIECPKCFEKFVYHGSESLIKDIDAFLSS